MKVHLRNTQENRYYSGPGQWTDDRRRARGFNDGGEAVQEAVRQKLLEAEVVYHFDNSRGEIAIPVHICEPLNLWGAISGRACAGAPMSR